MANVVISSHKINVYLRCRMVEPRYLILHIQWPCINCVKRYVRTEIEYRYYRFDFIKCPHMNYGHLFIRCDGDKDLNFGNNFEHVMNGLCFNQFDWNVVIRSAKKRFGKLIKSGTASELMCGCCFDTRETVKNYSFAYFLRPHRVFRWHVKFLEHEMKILEIKRWNSRQKYAADLHPFCHDYYINVLRRKRRRSFERNRLFGFFLLKGDSFKLLKLWTVLVESLCGSMLLHNCFRAGASRTNTFNFFFCHFKPPPTSNRLNFIQISAARHAKNLEYSAETEKFDRRTGLHCIHLNK